jgi:hypothetical protein
MPSFSAYELQTPSPLSTQINFTCKDCPLGADCRTDNQTRAGVVPLPGYYADVSKANDMFVRCLLPTSCVGGKQVCAPPYVGPLCSGCDAGFHVNTDWSCSKYVAVNANILFDCMFVEQRFDFRIVMKSHVSIACTPNNRCPEPWVNQIRILGISIAVLLGCIGSVYMAIASAESQVRDIEICLDILKSDCHLFFRFKFEKLIIFYIL